MTEWLPIPGFEDYLVSDRGAIARMTPRGRKMLRPGHNVSGHLYVNLYDVDGRRHREYVHRLVLFAFVGQPAPDQECCHWDDDPENNALTNLRWDTSEANHADRRRNQALRAA